MKLPVHTDLHRAALFAVASPLHSHPSINERRRPPNIFAKGGILASHRRQSSLIAPRLSQTSCHRPWYGHDKTGRLNKCEPKSGCISTFDEPDVDSSHLTYQPGYSTQSISANDARRAALRREAALEAAAENGGELPRPTKKSAAEAMLSSKSQKANNGVIVEEGFDWYLRRVHGAGTFGSSIDDVEFLSLDAPIVGYRSAARKGTMTSDS